MGAPWAYRSLWPFQEQALTGEKHLMGVDYPVNLKCQTDAQLQSSIKTPCFTRCIHHHLRYLTWLQHANLFYFTELLTMGDCFKRFRQVTDHVDSQRTLYRSSAPHYRSDQKKDEPQTLDDACFQFLTGNNITTIISLNEYPYDDPSQARLHDLGISYHRFRVDDYQSPSPDQFQGIYDVYNGTPANSCTLIHCGYGQGRTGTGVSGIQLYCTYGRHLRTEEEWEEENGVERPVQYRALEALRDTFPVSQITIP